MSSTLFDDAAPLIGYIDESRHIYDVKMPHFSYQVDRLLDDGVGPAGSTMPKYLLAMVRDVDTSHGNSLPSVSLTLLNSRLTGSK